MNAKEARGLTHKWHVDAQSEHDKWRKEEDARVAKATAARKKVRWEPFLKEIYDAIGAAAHKGGRSLTFDDMISFEGEDEILFEPMKKHLESEGFECEEYQGWLLKIEW